MAEVFFLFEGNKTTIQCLKDDKMGNICRKYSSKIGIDINSLCFLYSGSQINFELTFYQQANNVDNISNNMNIIVFKLEQDKLICPKCGEKINFDKKIIDKLEESNTNAIDILGGLQIQIENIIKDRTKQNNINFIKMQLKNINLLINNVILGVQKNNDLIFQVINFKKNERNNIINYKQNTIEGILDVNFEDRINGVVLFNGSNKDGIDVFLNGKKINMMPKKNQWKINDNFLDIRKNKFKIVFNTPITSLYRFFENNSALFSVDLSNFDTSNINDFGWAFNRCKKLKEIKGLNHLNTSKVISMIAMFQECHNLEYLDLSYFDTSNVIDMSCMFNQCKSLKKIKGINKFNTSNVLNMEMMFQCSKEIEYLDLSNFDTSKVYSMEYMFNQCHKLRRIKGINKFNTSHTNRMGNMFLDCKKLEYLDLSNYDTSNVYYMNKMFANCIELENLDLSNFNTSNVIDMSGMFGNCSKLKKIKGINYFNTSEVTNMRAIFAYCKELEYLDLSNFDTSEVSNMELMFAECHKLKKIKGINKFNTSKVTNLRQMFQGCKSLEYLDLSNFDTSKVINMQEVFDNSHNLKYLNLWNFTNPPEPTKNMFSLIDKKNCKLITYNKNLNNLFYNS